jgi:putative oxidoreductase
MDIKFFVKIARSFLGLALIIFGVNYFVGFLGIPIPEGNAAVFVKTIGDLGYFFPLIAISCLVLGFLLIANIFVPIALLLLFPINLNILLFNILYSPVNISVSIALFLAHLFLLWYYRERYRGVGV